MERQEILDKQQQHCSRNGDILESVGDRVIDDLDSALNAYVELGQESPLHVRIEREAKWLDFTYTFVP